MPARVLLPSFHCCIRTTKAHTRQPSLISAFVIYYLEGIAVYLAPRKNSTLYLVSVAEQAGFSLTWSETQKTDFLTSNAHINYKDKTEFKLGSDSR